MNLSPTPRAPVTYARTELREFLAFIRKPRRHKTVGSPRLAWVQRVLFFGLVSMLVLGVLALPMAAVAYWTGLEHAPLPGQNYLQSLLYVGLVAPLVEELMCRWQLRSRAYTISVGPLLLMLLLVNSPLTFFVWLTVCVLLVALSLRYLGQIAASDAYRRQFNRQFITAYPKVFWFYAVAFAFVHIKHYDLSNDLASFVLVLLLPQLMLGLMAGYLRLKDGLKSSLLLHALWNALVLAGTYGLEA